MTHGLLLHCKLDKYFYAITIQQVRLNILRRFEQWFGNYLVCLLTQQIENISIGSMSNSND